MTDRENVIGIPELIGIVSIDDPCDLISDVGRAAPAMREPVDGMRAPVASVRAAPRGDQVDAAGSMMLSPDVQVLLVIDGLTIRKRQCVEVRNLRALRCMHGA